MANKIRRVIMTTVFLFVVAGLLIYGRSLLPKAHRSRVDVTTPTRGEFVINLLVDGTLESEDSQVVRTGKATGGLTMIVPDGTIVQKGDVFCRIEARGLERDRTDAELAVKQANEEIDRTRMNAEENYELNKRALEQAQEQLKVWEDEVRTRTAQAESQLAFDRAELQRLGAEHQRDARMANKGYKPAAEVVISKAAFDAQQFKVEQSIKSLELNRVEIDSERRQQQSTITSAERRVAIAKSRITGQGSYARDRAKRAAQRLRTITEALEESTITAPISGTVSLFSTYQGGERRPWKEGDNVGAGTPLGSISGNRQMAVRCRVKENDIAKLHTGQQAEIEFDAVPGPRFEGSLSSVGLIAREVWAWEDPNAEGNERVFDVLVAVKQGGNSRLKAGLNAKVSIFVQRLPNALFVPLDAVFSERGKSFVYVKHGRNFVRRAVLTGERNDVAVVIRSGLDGKEHIALTDPSKMTARAKRSSRWVW